MKLTIAIVALVTSAALAGPAHASVTYDKNLQHHVGQGALRLP